MTGAMEIIAHRRNTLAQLRETPPEYGVEIDLRSQGSRLILHHDPFVEGEDFEAWLSEYRHGTLILNVKEEGLEDALLAMMAAAGIENFFFLDQSFPFLIRTARRGEPRCAVRVSEFESIDTALTLKGLVRWAWVDCFTRLPLTTASAQALAQAGLDLCLVSPELQGRPAETEIPRMRAELAALGVTARAVCTKAPQLWL